MIFIHNIQNIKNILGNKFWSFHENQDSRMSFFQYVVVLVKKSKVCQYWSVFFIYPCPEPTTLRHSSTHHIQHVDLYPMKVQPINDQCLLDYLSSFAGSIRSVSIQHHSLLIWMVGSVSLEDIAVQQWALHSSLDLRSSLTMAYSNHQDIL